MSPFESLLLFTWAVVTVGLWIHLWKQPASVGRRILWSLVILVPAFGWAAYGGWFEVPPPLHLSQRVRPHPFTLPGRDQQEAEDMLRPVDRE